MIQASFLSGHAGSACLEQRFSLAGNNDDPQRHLCTQLQEALALIACNRERLLPIPGCFRRVLDQRQFEENGGAGSIRAFVVY